jgi:tetratricopeptide (TPR) repeat protein
MDAQHDTPTSRLRPWLFGLLLLVATLAAYHPAWRGTPIWDDAAHLTYPEIRSLHGLVRIWTEPGVTQQYYPVVFSAFWLEHKLWGDATLGYHLVNILLHVTGAFLLFRILRTLEVRAAWLAAAIFALHPVQVETVAWISELKNTLSGVCYLGAGLVYLRFDRSRNKVAYAIAVAIFVFGLLAKTVIATFPAALLVVFWWKRGQLSWKQDVLPLIPFFAVGITAGLFTSWMETHHVGAEGSAYNFSFVERCLIAGRAVWFYLGKLVWPQNLIFSYPRWKISQAAAWQYLFPIAAVVLLATLLVISRWRRGPLAAFLFFGGTLFPVLGFLNVFPFKYSFVADHFQYLACIGPIVAASVGIHVLFRTIKGAQWENFAKTCCVLLLVTLSILTWRQSHIYKDIETLWRATISRNPDCWLAQDDLGAILYERGRVNEAIIRFRASLAINPDDAEAHNNLGSALDKTGHPDEAITEFQKALTIRPAFAEAHWNIGNILLQKNLLDEAISEYEKAAAIRPDSAKLHFSLANALLQKGDGVGAIAEFRATLALHPNDEQAHYNLANVLYQHGQKEEAISEYQTAINIRPDFAEAQNNLGNAFLQMNKPDEAITHLRRALELQPDYPQAQYNLGNALLQKGRPDEAITQFEKLLALQPKSPEARKAVGAIAWKLAASSNPSMRNGTQAVKLAEDLDHLSGGTDAGIAAILAAAYAETGKFELAVDAAQRALQLARSESNAAMVTTIQAQLESYKAGLPFQDTRR